MTQPTHPLFAVVSLALLVAALDVGCDDIIDDASFQAWCGDELCNWQVESGSIARVGTWHPRDYGVELVDTPTVLSQVADDAQDRLLEPGDLDITTAEFEAACGELRGFYRADANQCITAPRVTSGCIQFELIADVDPSAQVEVELDYGADGTVDVMLPLVASDWEPVSFLAATPIWQEVIGYRIHKRGEGRAVVAHFGVTRAEDCVDEVPRDGRPLGVGCGDADQCISGICSDIASWSACSECESDASCDAGETCQVVFPDEGAPRAFRTCRSAP